MDAAKPTAPHKNGDGNNTDGNNAELKTETQLARKPHRYNANSAMAIPRSIRAGSECVIRGSIFNFVHKLEGKWSGDWQEVAMNPPLGAPVNPRAVSTKVTYYPHGFWILRETSAAEDGAASVHFLKLSPIDSGLLSVQLLQEGDPLAEPCQNAANVSLREMVNGARLETRNPITGQLSLFELIVISNGGFLTRTTNTYSVDGDLECVAISRQRRVTQ